MSKCPFCKTKLTDADLQSGKCPSCSKLLGDAERPPKSPTDSTGTVDESVLSDGVEGMQTIDDADPVGAGDAGGSVGRPATTGPATTGPATTGPATTEGGSEIGRTIDDSAGAGKPPSGTKTITDDAGQTSDEGTVDTEGILRTVQDTSPVPKSPDADRHTIEETFVVSQSSDAERQTIADPDPVGDVDRPSADIGRTIDESEIDQDAIDQNAKTAERPEAIMKTIDEAAEESAAGPSDSDVTRTIDESAGASSAPRDNRQTVADDASPAGSDIGRTIEESAASPPAPVDERQTVADDAVPSAGAVDRTIEEPAIPRRPPVDPSSKTVADDPIGQTVDLGPGELEKTKEGTVPDIEQTIDLDDPSKLEKTKEGTVSDIGQTVEIPDAMGKDVGTVGERSVVQTIDEQLAPDVVARINNTWSGTIDEGATVNTSLKSAETRVGGATSLLVIQQRAFRQSDDSALLSADYDLLSLLGEGGMGMVYAARQASIDRTVAVKMLKPQTSAEETQRNKFLSEAVVTGDLEHPNIVPIYDVGRNAEGALFYAMKRVQGTPWIDVLDEKSLHENLEILMKVGDAVGFAHSRGIVHRDLKPENVMLGGFGEVLVMDWGLAIPTDRRKIAGIEPSLSMGGTPAYMAPEMAAGPFERIGPHSDVYLMGAMLFEIVTGRPPHTGKDVMKCLFAAAKNDIQPPHKSGELVDIAMIAMSTKPDDRYATVTDFQNAIREYLSHSESISLSVIAEDSLAEAEQSNDYQDFAHAMFGFQQARELWDGNKRAAQGLREARLKYAGCAKRKGDFDLAASLLHADDPEHKTLLGQIRLAKAEVDARQQRIKRLRRVMQGGVALFVIVVLLFSGWVWVERSAAIAAKDEAEEAKDEAVDARDAEAEERLKAEKARDDARAAQKKEQLAKEQERLAKQTAEEEEFNAKVSALLAVIAREDAERAQKIAVQERDNARAAQEKEEIAKRLAEEEEFNAKVSALLAVIAREDAEHAEQVAVQERDNARAAQEKEEIAKRAAEEEEFNAKVSELLASIARDDAKAAEIEERKAKEKVAYEAYVARIASAAAKIDDNAFDRAREILDECVPKQEGDPDFRGWEWGRLMQLCGLSKTNFDVGASVECIAYSPSRKQNRFATGDSAGNVVIWNVDEPDEAKKKHLTITPGAGQIHALGYSPNGALLAVGGGRTGSPGQPGYVQIYNAETGELVQTLNGRDGNGHQQPVLSVAFSRDGKQLLTSSYDHTAKLWDWQSDTVLRDFVGHKWWVWDAQFSPDETQIVTASQDGTVLVWSTRTAIPRPAFRGHKGPVYTATFSPTGGEVASAGYDKRILVWNPANVAEFDYEKEKEDYYAKVLDQEAGRSRVAGPASGIERPRYQTLVGHTALVRDLAFAGHEDEDDKGKYLVSASHDRTLKEWNLVDGGVRKTLRGHGEWVRCLAIAPDAKTVVSGGHDQVAKLWSIPDYEEVRVLEAEVLTQHLDAILDAEFSDKGKYIVTAGRDRTAIMWDVATGRPARIGDSDAIFREGHDFLASNVVFFADGTKMATAARDGTVRVWDVNTGTQLRLLKGTGRGAAVAATSDGARIITSGNGLPDPTTGEIVSALIWEEGNDTPKILGEHLQAVTAVAMSPDDAMFATGDAAGRINLWDTQTGRLLRSLRAHTRKITALNFHPSAARLLSASLDTTVTQWDVASGEVLEHLTLQHRPFGGDTGVTGLAVSKNADGAFVLTCCADGKARLWNADDARLIRTLEPMPKTDDREGVSGINAVAFSADGRSALTVNSTLHNVRLWDLAMGQEQMFDNGQPFLHFKSESDVSISSAAFLPDGAHVVTVGGDQARMWKIDDELPQADRAYLSFNPHGAVATARFSPDGGLIVTVGADDSIRFWKTDDPDNAARKLTGVHTDSIHSVLFSPDGETILTASEDGTAKIIEWKTADPENAAARVTFEGHTAGVTFAAFSADGRRVVTASKDNTAKIWDAATGELLGTLQGHTGALSRVAFSRDGQWVVTGSTDSTARIWNAVAIGDKEIGGIAIELRGHTAAVSCVAFSPDGRNVLTGSADFSAMVWDVSKLDAEQIAKEIPASNNPEPLQHRLNQYAKEVLTLVGHSQPIESVAFSQDGLSVVTAGNDRKAIIWRAIDWSTKPADKAAGEQVSAR